MELETPVMWLSIEQGLLVGIYKENVAINLAMAREIVQIRTGFMKGRSMPALIMGKGVITMERKAREFLASTEGTKGLSATAIIVSSTYSSMLGNFFLTVNRPKMPVKIFTEVSKAKKWARQFIK